MSASGVDVLVRGGRVVTSTDVVEAAVAIRGDKIVAIGPDSLLPKADRVIDASGKLVLPGLIDCHLHVGPEYDDWRTAPLAAARTGLTTLLPFVTYEPGETLPKATARLREEAESLSVLDFEDRPEHRQSGATERLMFGRELRPLFVRERVPRE